MELVFGNCSISTLLQAFTFDANCLFKTPIANFRRLYSRRMFLLLLYVPLFSPPTYATFQTSPTSPPPTSSESRPFTSSTERPPTPITSDQLRRINHMLKLTTATEKVCPIFVFCLLAMSLAVSVFCSKPHFAGTAALVERCASFKTDGFVQG